MMSMIEGLVHKTQFQMQPLFCSFSARAHEKQSSPLTLIYASTVHGPLIRILQTNSYSYSTVLNVPRVHFFFFFDKMG